MTRTRHRQANASKEYDVLDRVTNVTYTARDGVPLYSLSYAYEPDGLVTQRVVTAASGAVTNAYAYDGLMRLVAESDSPGNSASYVYDPCGNRLSVTTPSGTVSSTYTHNRRDADTYDAGGRVTRTVNGRGQVLDLAWNLRGELVSVSTNGAFAEGYAYDPMGRRIATTDSSGTVYHAYDGIHCVADLAPDGTLLRSYTWGSGVDNLLAVTLYSATETNTLYAVTDPLGTVHALVAADGTSQLYSYDSWGNPTVTSQPLSFPASQLRFTWQGREYSYATGLYHFRARWYDPSTGRWLSKDPIGLEGGLNLYEAFGNNPVCFGDPDGGKIVNPQKDKRIDNAIQKIQNALVKAYKEEHPCPTKKGKRNQILKAFNHLLSTKVFEVHIYITSGENCYVSKKSTDNQTGKNLLYWNPDLWVSNLNSEGNKTRPPEIGLAHELAHAIDDVLGRLEYDVQSPSSNLHKNVGAPNNEERRAVEFENWVRDAMGVPLRILY